MIGMAVFANWIAPYSYDETIRGARMKPPGAQFWMGTDNLGRDIFSRVVYGARVSVTVGFGAVLLANFLATVIGITSGYFGGKYDICVQRVVDAWQSFPFLVVILSIMAVLGPGMLNVILALGVLGAAAASRVIRGATISDHPAPLHRGGARHRGGHIRIMCATCFPTWPPPSSSSPPSGSAGAILAESALSFLGFGVPPPYPSWGAMLSGSGRSYMYRAPWMAIWPGAAISLAVFGFNMLGDASATSSTPACAARAAGGFAKLRRRFAHE